MTPLESDDSAEGRAAYKQAQEILARRAKGLKPLSPAMLALLEKMQHQVGPYDPRIIKPKPPKN